MAGKWPPECPDCGSSWGMRYTSDRTGNARRYACSCGAVFLATLKGMPSGSALADLGAVRQNEMTWTRVRKEKTG
jgi:hypothetical protein